MAALSFIEIKEEPIDDQLIDILCEIADDEEIHTVKTEPIEDDAHVKQASV